MGKAYFGPEFLQFLKQIKRNNRRPWFLKNRERYEEVSRCHCMGGGTVEEGEARIDIGRRLPDSGAARLRGEPSSDRRPQAAGFRCERGILRCPVVWCGISA